MMSMTTHPHFSIIVPTYNRAYVLSKTVLSIQEQRFPDWELLVVDDGSTDDTRQLMEAFSSDARIRYFYKENDGPSSARNTGLDYASGEIIVYVDSDDTLTPECLATAHDCFARSPNKIYAVCNHYRRLEYVECRNGSCYVIASEDLGLAHHPNCTLQDFYDRRVKTTSTGLFHRRSPFAGKVRWRDTVMLEDLEFLMQLAVIDEQGFMHIPQGLVNYVQRAKPQMSLHQMPTQREENYSDPNSHISLCANATDESYARAFQIIYDLHKDDPLMRPAIYLDRIKKYTDLHQSRVSGHEEGAGGIALGGEEGSGGGAGIVEGITGAAGVSGA